MKKQESIDLDRFDDDISLWQMIPCGKMGQSLLKLHVDAVLNGRAKLNSLLLVGKEGLSTHASAFLRALGIDIYNHTNGSMLQHVSGIHQFFCAENYDGFIIENIDEISSDVQKHLYTILKEKHFSPYNYMKQGVDLFEIPQPVVLTTKDMKEVAEPILKNVQHIVKLEDYGSEQRILIILQRLKYAHIEYENDSVLSDIVKYGRNDLRQSITFLKTCIAIIQSRGRQILLKEDIQRASRLSYSPVPPPPIPDDIPY